MKLLQGGNQRRTTEPTAMNVTSSRSHAVFQVRVERRDREAATLGKLSLIDLAGSERASQTHNSGMRLLEGANINRSLLALGNCINALASGSAFAPFRDSKLTRLLKDSLGGNCRTVTRSCCSCLPRWWVMLGYACIAFITYMTYLIIAHTSNVSKLTSFGMTGCVFVAKICPGDDCQYLAKPLELRRHVEYFEVCQPSEKHQSQCLSTTHSARRPCQKLGDFNQFRANGVSW